MTQSMPKSTSNRLSKKNSNNIYALNQLAILARHQCEFSKAETHWLQAIKLWPNYPSAHYNLGILYELYTGKLELALQHYQTYQSLIDEPDKRVALWIADLKRRLQ